MIARDHLPIKPMAHSALDLVDASPWAAQKPDGVLRVGVA